jgi:hypothetical protein
MWEMPSKPEYEPVTFAPQSGGYFVSTPDSIRLANNTDKLKAYAVKLEILVETMQEYYK